MNVIILAAGQGSRMGKLTSATPKPLLPIGDTNVISRLISQLLKRGVKQITIVVGFKAETFKNLFVSVSGSYKILMSAKEPENFQTLYSPGFNRIFESGTGFGFNYTISYLIPFTKR